jgi:hypothetical protein
MSRATLNTDWYQHCATLDTASVYVSAIASLSCSLPLCACQYLSVYSELIHVEDRDRAAVAAALAVFSLLLLLQYKSSHANLAVNTDFYTVLVVLVAYDDDTVRGSCCADAHTNIINQLRILLAAAVFCSIRHTHIHICE